MKTPFRVEARFQLDKNGHPKYETEGDTRHYYIDLRTFTDEPNVETVTYGLDPTYYDSRREADNSRTNFHEEITSYGDYTLTVYLTGPGVRAADKVRLYELLKQSHHPPENEHVARALHDIKSG